MSLFHLLEILQVRSELFIPFFLVDRPVLERHLGAPFEVSYRLLKQHHHSLYKKTARAAERIPQVQFASLIRLFQNPALQDTSGGQCLTEHAPSNKWFISVLMQFFIGSANEYLSPVLDYVDMHLA